MASPAFLKDESGFFTSPGFLFVQVFFESGFRSMPDTLYELATGVTITRPIQLPNTKSKSIFFIIPVNVCHAVCTVFAVNSNSFIFRPSKLSKMSKILFAYVVQSLSVSSRILLLGVSHGFLPCILRLISTVFNIH